jgi:multidrug efflux pump subunit AcrA (membrane-fusion protein)
MNKGRIGILLAILVIVLGVVLKNKLSTSKEEPTRRSSQREMVVVTDTVQNGPIEVSVPITGRLIARDKVEIFAEVSGSLLPSSDAFREGNRFDRGALLIAIDDSESRANLIAQKSTFLSNLTAVVADIKFDFPEEYTKYETYLLHFDVEEPLHELPKINSEKERLFLTSRNVYSSFYNIRSAETRLSKFQIHAPFDGLITQALIRPGTLVRAGQKLGEFISTTNYELEVALNAKDGQFVKVGDEIDLNELEGDHHWHGKVVRINDRIDPGTQTITIFIGVKGNGLKEGLFLSAALKVEEVENAFEVDRRLLQQGDKMLIIEDDHLRFHSVEVVRFTEKTAIVRGLENGMIVPESPVVGGYEGMKVLIGS